MNPSNKKGSIHVLASAGMLAMALFWGQAGDTVSTLEASSAWTMWRGPFQTGAASEHLNNVAFPADGKPKWTLDMPGRGTPVVLEGRAYAWGYKGEGKDVYEALLCLDLKTGKVHWERRFNDFISDVIYNRYSIGAPTVDPKTGRVFLMTSNGVVMALDRDGKTLWEISMMEQYGRLTFPNGRSGCPILVDDLVIVRGITTNWGKQGPARDRFYALKQDTGKLVWSSTPGVRPQDSSFSTPFVETRYGRKLFYAGTGCGNVVAVNALNGKPLWRFQMSKGGVNSSPVVLGDRLVCIHGKENLDTTEKGRMIAIKLPERIEGGEQIVLDEKSELWRCGLSSFTSSPVLAGDRIYQIVETGELNCVDPASGKILWHEKLERGNLHSSPLFYSDLLFVPMNSGKLFVGKPTDSGFEKIAEVQLEGGLLGAPSASDGHLLVHSQKKLYCFELKGEKGYKPVPGPGVPEKGKAAALRLVPGEVLVSGKAKVPLEIEVVDAGGNVLQKISEAKFESFIPPTAKVKSTMDAMIDSPNGVLQTSDRPKLSAGMFKASAKVDGQELSGTVRGRAFPGLPLKEDFSGFDAVIPHATEPDVKFAYPPLPWIGARFKWEIRELDGNKVLAKTLDRLLFQRSMTFIGTPEMSNYTLSADVMTDGNRRSKSTVGLINQRYIIALRGNANVLEVNSNHERVKESVPFPVSAGVWYRMKTRVDMDKDGKGFVRGKVWKKGAPEPKEWTIQVEHNPAHRKGSPGLFGFSPQSQKRVYVDNIEIVPN